MTKNQSKHETFILTSLFEAKDDLDKNILNKTMNMIMGLQIDFLLPDKKSSELHFSYTKEMTESLLKANSHRRKYFIQKEQVSNDFREKCINNKNKTIQATHSVELDTEIDGVLIHIKATLDSLAKTFNPLFGFDLRGWNKKKNESGRKVILSLQNLPEDIKNKACSLINFIEDNIQWISYLVFLRDKPNHYGGIKSVSDIIFKPDVKEIIPQYISHNNSQREDVGVFLTRAIEEITQFVHIVLVLSLITKSLGGMVIIENKKDDFPPYRWAITKN